MMVHYKSMLSFDIYYMLEPQSDSDVSHIVPVNTLGAFRALKLSRLEIVRALKSIGPTTLQIGEF